jgi:hypothetical protein
VENTEPVICRIARRRFRSDPDGCIFASRWVDLLRARLDRERRISAAADA